MEIIDLILLARCCKNSENRDEKNMKNGFQYTINFDCKKWIFNIEKSLFENMDI
jgi:hypothetical protein